VTRLIDPPQVRRDSEQENRKVALDSNWLRQPTLHHLVFDFLMVRFAVGHPEHLAATLLAQRSSLISRLLCERHEGSEELPD